MDGISTIMGNDMSTSSPRSYHPKKSEVINLVNAIDCNSDDVKKTRCANSTCRNNHKKMANTNIESDNQSKHMSSTVTFLAPPLSQNSGKPEVINLVSNESQNLESSLYESRYTDQSIYHYRARSNVKENKNKVSFGTDTVEYGCMNEALTFSATHNQNKKRKLTTQFSNDIPSQNKRHKTSPSSSSSSSGTHHVKEENNERQFPTELSFFCKSRHGKLRRSQRNISIRELQLTRKYGKRTPGRRCRNGHTSTMYDWNGLRYIEDDVTKKEITSYATRMDLKCWPLSDNQVKLHKEALRKINESKSSWRTHFVCLVDTSGSMRKSDVKGARSRLDAVWLALAVDYVKFQIQSGQASDQDVITVITMGEQSNIVIDQQPMDWVLFNKLVNIYNGNHFHRIKPKGHGYFLPALEKAEEILMQNPYSSCSLALTVYSDGRPSDNATSLKFAVNDTKVNRVNDAIVKKIENISSKLGKRFTFTAIGIGSATEFKSLELMTETAKDYGSEAFFKVPSMTTSDLGAAMSSVTTSLAKSHTAMTIYSVDGKKTGIKTVRNVLRERQSTLPALTEDVDKDDFHIYMGNNVTRKIYDVNANGCFKDAPLQHPDAVGVAIRKKAFGEGTERICYQFFEIAADGHTVVGHPLVAKESRFVEDYTEEGASKEKYARKFCNLQYKAQEMAKAFNEKIDNLKILNRETARVSFLDCSTYYIDGEGLEKKLLLVERRLHQKFQKWNNNNGAVYRNKNKLDKSYELITINDCNDHNEADTFTSETCIHITPSEVAQAFSHFSYHFSGEKCLICDLQGSYDNVGKMFYFTDPVIHYYDKQNCNKKHVFGRTDRGREGFESFLGTHCCNALCDLVTKGLKNVCT